MTQYHQTILKRDAQGNLIQDSYTGDMTFRGEYTGTNLIYKGYSRPGAVEGDSVWQICKIAYDGSNNITSIKWPQGDNAFPSSEFNFSWTNRASYTYA
jgi:hypothetical protein